MKIEPTGNIPDNITWQQIEIKASRRLRAQSVPHRCVVFTGLRAVEYDMYYAIRCTCFHSACVLTQRHADITV